MGKLGGGALRLFSTLLYFLEFCCAAVGLGIYSYFLAKLAANDAPIAQRWRAVEGLVGSAVLYTIFAVLLTCFLGGVRVFGFIAIVLNVLFAGAMIAVAVLTRDGADSCNGFVETPIANGPSNLEVFDVRLHTYCRLNTAVFAVSIIAAFLFLLSAVFQIFIVRHHQKEKKFGPSPTNGYTSGSAGRKFWQRKPKTVTKDAYGYDNTTTTAAPAMATNNRHSYDTAQTGLTGTTDHTKYEPSYHTGPTGTGVNNGYTTQPTQDTTYLNYHGTDNRATNY